MCNVTFYDALLFREPEIRDFYLQHRILPRFLICGLCGRILWANGPDDVVRCRAMIRRRKQRPAPCGWSRSIRDGSWLNQVRIPLQKLWFFILFFLWTPHPRTQVLRSLNLSASSVTDWSNFAREVCSYYFVINPIMIGGEGHIVEIDEAKVGKRKYNRGRVIEGQWVFGGIDRSSKKFFVVAVPDRTTDTLLNIIQANVRPGTTIHSDCWRAYRSLPEHGYIHRTVNHSLNFVDPETGTHTNTIERLWRELRAGIPRFGGTTKEHFDNYLKEFTFKKRFPSFHSRLHHFYATASQLYPVYPKEEDPAV